LPESNKLGFILTSPKSENDFELYYRFRWQQLRQPLNLAEGSERDSFHCMALDNDNSIIGIGSIQSCDSGVMREHATHQNVG
jgi:hypothetical protein|tara:strand:- start:144 stop:389 length:246 start_codon:yes stop_codon:yes gene_type:complete